MSDSRSSFTLRDLRRHLTRRDVAAALLGAGVVLGIAGPFGTDETLRAAPRIAYWVVVVAVTWTIGYAVGATLGPMLRRRGWPVWSRVAADGLATGLLITPAVGAINWASFGALPRGVAGWAVFAFTLTAIATVIAAAGAGFGRNATARAAPPPILRRLPPAKRGALASLSAEDHYVRVRTDRGEALLLMRLTDAIAETAPVAGLRTHRSHWVALDAVADARRVGDRAELTLTDGTTVPVSRANLPALRKAGLV